MLNTITFNSEIAFEYAAWLRSVHYGHVDIHQYHIRQYDFELPMSSMLFFCQRNDFALIALLDD